jgi:nucleotide-binding universal stress UspA family protein
MDKTLRELNTQNVRIRKITATGKTADTLLEQCKSSACDLIVLGTRGHSSVSGILLGSVTQKILAKAPCPVLVVK